MHYLRTGEKGMTDLTRFPNAPTDAELTPEGWLIVHDEAWDEAQWALLTTIQRRAITGDVPCWDDSEDDVKLRRKRVRDRRRRVAA